MWGGMHSSYLEAARQAHDEDRGSPDRFSQEVVLAWRNWKVDTKILEKGHIWMHSLFNKECFWFGYTPLTAYCKYAPKNTRDNHKSPRLHCECGIYGHKEIEPAYNYARTTVKQCSVVFGQVSLWGRMIECEKGWKAEYAYPYSFIVPKYDNDSEVEVANALSKQFAVDVEIKKLETKQL